MRSAQATSNFKASTQTISLLPSPLEGEGLGVRGTILGALPVSRNFKTKSNSPANSIAVLRDYPSPPLPQGERGASVVFVTETTT